MIVCACQNITLDDIVEAVEKLGNDADTIREYTQAGKGCESCLEAACEEVDLPFPYALINAEAIIKQKN
ncbi:MAG: (2Fe-2S)-binding protein [Sulfuricurvum sp.]|nr:(2Fe-2S)-binding protein [Sulfuricurvum sp.]